MTMWMQGVKAELKIKKVDNGFILEWEKEKPKPPAWNYAQQQMGQTYEPEPRGVEIIVKPADLLKRVKELI
jgi:hypothetical protein